VRPATKQTSSRFPVRAVSDITCDRCGKEIDGFRGEYATAGFYDVTGQSWWSRYARPGERNVCDDCMWQDAGYRADYGVHLSKPEALRVELEEVDAIVREHRGETSTTSQ
jgi:hypothetical protein